VPYCTKCGTQVAESQRYCGNCGSTLTATSSNSFTHRTRFQPKWLLPVAVLGLVSLGVVSYLSFRLWVPIQPLPVNTPTPSTPYSSTDTKAQQASSAPEAWYLIITDPETAESLEDLGMVPPVYSTEENCELGKENDPMITGLPKGNLVEKSYQCVSSNDSRWDRVPPQDRWFLFWAANFAPNPISYCISLNQISVNHVPGQSSFITQAECEKKGHEFADSMLGEPSKRFPPQLPDCTYCIKGNNPILREPPS
jgi:hypothetical protein